MYNMYIQYEVDYHTDPVQKVNGFLWVQMFDI